NDPHILEAGLEQQYQELVLNNLNHSPPPSSPQPPDVVIIDGLDECSDSATQKHVLSIIFSTYQTHSPLRFLLCSRPESWIQDSFNCQEFSSLTRHIKLDHSFNLEHDIRYYLHWEFENIRRDPKYKQVHFPDPWPSPEIIQLLVEKADGQFIYAATVIKFI
ncbi:hypothetical protein L218DRAFT_834347, partial [Marasmius fiardii PR-910]